MRQWTCPCCGSHNLDYGCFELEGEWGFFPRTCENCWAEGDEWYSLNFDEHIIVSQWDLVYNQKENVWENITE